MKTINRYLFAALLLGGVLACDTKADESAAEPDVKDEVDEDATAPAVKPLLAAAEFDLESVSFMVRKGQVKDGKALERAINDKKNNINKVDIDGDGKVDKITVVEVRDGATTHFELKVAPSSKRKSKNSADYVTIAILEFEPLEAESKIKVSVYYSEVVAHGADETYTFEVKASFLENRVVVEDGVFVAWVYKSRPVFYGAHYYVKVVIVDEGCWPTGHCTHVRWDVSHNVEININYRKSKRRKGRRRGGGDDDD